MANIVTKTVVINGAKSLFIHAYLESDGNEGELTNYVLFDPRTDLDSVSVPNKRQQRLTLRQVWHSFAWFDTLISFDELNPVPSWLLHRDAASYTDLRYFGGLKDRYIDPKDKDSSDRTGKILLTTTDFAPLNSKGTLVLELWKSEA